MRPESEKYMDTKTLFESFKNVHVLVVGDVIIDSYLWGDVSRISPEAPVQIIKALKREHRLGGAANVALNVQALGATPLLCSVAGDDGHRKVFEKLMKKRGLITDGIVFSSQRDTSVKTRIISQNQHLLRIDDETDQPLTKDVTELLIKRIKKLLSEYKIDAIIFEDYDKGVITPGLIGETVKFAKERGIPTLVDPKKRNFNNYNGVTFFKPNFKEFLTGLNLDLKASDKEKLVKVAGEFRMEHDIRVLMITLAEKGVFVSDDNGHLFIPAEVRNISDVSGAGDTVISVSALCLAFGLRSEAVARIANMAGGLVCEIPGVVPVSKELLLQECLDKKVL